MSGVRELEIFNTRSGVYADTELQLRLRRLLQLEYVGPNRGVTLKCCRCGKADTTRDADPVFLAGRMDVSVFPPRVNVELTHNLNYLCATCRDSTAKPAADGLGAAGPSRLRQAVAASPQQQPEEQPIAAGGATAAARAVGLASGPGGETDAAWASAAGAGEGAEAVAPGGQRPLKLSLDERYEVASGPVKGKSLQDVAISVTFRRVYLVSLESCLTVSAASRDTASPSSESAVRGSSAPVAAPACGSATSPLPDRLHSAEAAAAWASLHADQLGEGDLARLRGLDFSLQRAARRTLAHALAAVADWVLAPHILNRMPGTGFAHVDAGPAGVRLVRLRPWALAVHANEDVAKDCNCVRPDLRYLACTALRRPAEAEAQAIASPGGAWRWSLMEVIKAPPLGHSLGLEVMVNAYEAGAPPASDTYTSACRAGWVLPLQRLAALMKRFHNKVEGPWQLAASRLPSRLLPLLEDDGLYGSDCNPSHGPGGQQHLHHQPGAGPPGAAAAAAEGPSGSSAKTKSGGGGGNAAGDAGKYAPVKAFLQDLGATPQQVLEVLALSDIDTNVGFCALCGANGNMAACDTCVDSFCASCLHVVNIETDLPTPWSCSFCEDINNHEPLAARGFENGTVGTIGEGADTDGGGSLAADPGPTPASSESPLRWRPAANPAHLPAEAVERPVRRRGRPPRWRLAAAMAETPELPPPVPRTRGGARGGRGRGRGRRGQARKAASFGAAAAIDDDGGVWDGAAVMDPRRLPRAGYLHARADEAGGLSWRRGSDGGPTHGAGVGVGLRRGVGVEGSASKSLEAANVLMMLTQQEQLGVDVVGAEPGQELQRRRLRQMDVEGTEVAELEDAMEEQLGPQQQQVEEQMGVPGQGEVLEQEQDAAKQQRRRAEEEGTRPLPPLKRRRKWAGGEEEGDEDGEGPSAEAARDVDDSELPHETAAAATVPAGLKLHQGAMPAATPAPAGAPAAESGPELATARTGAAPRSSAGASAAATEAGVPAAAAAPDSATAVASSAAAVAQGNTQAAPHAAEQTRQATAQGEAATRATGTPAAAATDGPTRGGAAAPPAVAAAPEPPRQAAPTLPPAGGVASRGAVPLGVQAEAAANGVAAAASGSAGLMATKPTQSGTQAPTAASPEAPLAAAASLASESADGDPAAGPRQQEHMPGDPRLALLAATRTAQGPGVLQQRPSQQQQHLAPQPLQPHTALPVNLGQQQLPLLPAEPLHPRQPLPPQQHQPQIQPQSPLPAEPVNPAFQQQPQAQPLPGQQQPEASDAAGAVVLSMEDATFLAFRVMEYATAQGVSADLVDAWLLAMDTALERYEAISPTLRSAISSCLRGLSNRLVTAPATASVTMRCAVALLRRALGLVH